MVGCPQVAGEGVRLCGAIPQLTGKGVRGQEDCLLGRASVSVAMPVVRAGSPRSQEA